MQHCLFVCRATFILVRSDAHLATRIAGYVLQLLRSQALLLVSCFKPLIIAVSQLFRPDQS